jgi:two-component system alkaline phosphatase synthesis response regulator PhoP
MNKTVLVVDDELPVLTVLRLKFEKAGYEVLTATDGVEALRVVEQGAPLAMITDNRMPRMSGVELCQACRRLRPSEPFLIIFISSRASLTSGREKGLVLGLPNTMFVSKPFSPRRLVEIVDAYTKGELKIQGKE